MTRQVIFSSACDYRRDQFVTLRMAERSRFPQGQEIEIQFTGRDPFEAFGMARRAAMVYAGLLTPGHSVNTRPFVSTLGPYQGHVLGSESHDGKQCWRIDWNPRTGEFHVNWWDRRLDTSRKGDRALHYYGANFVTGGSQDLFWEIESHFPGQVARKKE